MLGAADRSSPGAAMGRVLVTTAAAVVVVTLQLLLLAGDDIAQLVSSSSYASVIGLQIVVILPFFIGELDRI